MKSEQLIGYVSDEQFVAIAGAMVEFIAQDGESKSVVSTASGSVYADLEPGQYRLVIARDGYTAKSISWNFVSGELIQIRLMTDRLMGYAWPKWSRGGESTQFRIHSVEAYRLSLWRYGKEKELVRLIGWIDEHAPAATTQILPDGDFTQTGVKWNTCGYPENFAGQRVQAPSRSGLYYFHAETVSGKFFSFPWVVAPATPQAVVAVLASTNTWNAYNNFGGRSNYINSTCLPEKPTVNSRQDLDRYTGAAYTVWDFADSEFRPLTFDRPDVFTAIPQDADIDGPVRGRQASHLAEAEWRLLAWLEREGRSYDYYADYHLHSGQLNLDAYKVLIISTHPEYWSRDQYFKVRDWVMQRGGKLMYLGGNGIDCEVVFNEDDSLSFLTSWPGQLPGLPIKIKGTDEVLECRLQRTTGESPATLLGVVFTDPGIGTGAPYTVTDQDSWIYEGTGLRNGDTFGVLSQHERCPGGASGHETDKRSASSPTQAVYVGLGQNVDDGGAEIATIEWPDGGEVFSCGSINWVTSLLVDPHIGQITRNVLTRFLM